MSLAEPFRAPADAWVYELREQFPAAGTVAFFDIAYENCGSTFAREAAERFFDDKAHVYPGMIKAGGKGKGDMIPVIAKTRALCARFLHCDDVKRIAFTKNTNDGVNIILHGFPFRPGDNIVTGDIEHVSVLGPCLNMENFGVSCRVARSRDNVSITADDLLDTLDGHTRMVVVSCVQSRSGYRIDLERLVRECHARGIYVVTDAIQALGFVDIDAEKLGVDAIASSCYKGLLATEGIGILYCARELTSLVRPVFLADNAATVIDRENCRVGITDPSDACKFENGTVSFMGAYMLSAGLERILGIGMQRIEEHVSDCFEELYGGLSALGYSILTPGEKPRRCHSILFETGDDAGAERFFFEHGVYLSRGVENCLRASVAPFTVREDIDRLISTASEWKARACATNKA